MSTGSDLRRLHAARSDETRSEGAASTARTWGASLALAGAAFAAGVSLARSSELLAAPGLAFDTDGDGLSDHNELILGTDLYGVDTDGDGFTDLEELARQSDPIELLQSPVPQPVSLGMTGRVADGCARILVPVYLEDANLAGMDFRVGVMVLGQVFEVVPSVYLPVTTAVVRPAKYAPDVVVSLELNIPESLIHTFGSISVYATARPLGAPAPIAAAVFNMVAANGVVMVVSPTHTTGFGGGGGSSANGSGIDVVFRPISEPDDIPTNWAPAQYCVQTTSTIGLVGSKIQQQVEAADCEPADGFCRPDCQYLVGTTFEMLDPLALIGG